jgi:hypothetical protein
MTVRQVAGTVLMVVGVWLVGWAARHYDEPLVGAPRKNGEPAYFGESRPLVAFATGLGARSGWDGGSTRQRQGAGPATIEA